MCTWFYFVDMEFIWPVEWLFVVDEAVSDVDEVVSAKELSEEGEEFSEEKDWDEVEVLVDELSDEEVLSVEEELSSDDEDESVTGSVVSSSGG